MKKFLILTAAVFAFFLSGITAFAEEDYSMTDCWWEEQDADGRIAGSFERCESATTYKVRLTYGSSRKVVRDWFTGTPSGTDFTVLIATKGSGTYYFDVYPAKGGTDYMISSDGLEVTSEMLSLAKKYRKEEAAARQASLSGWQKGPDGYWRYYKQGGTACKSEWLDDGGKRYHFDSNSVMQTGWQAIGGYWYYFDQSGALLVSTVTPDGYGVDAEGKYIDENGNPVPAASSGSSSSSGRTLSSISIRVSEQSKGAGQVSTAAFSAGSGFEIAGELLSIPREQWRAGEAVTVTLRCVPKSGYTFAAGTVKATVSGAENIQVTGGTTERTVKFVYKPKMKLETPVGFRLNESMELTWKKVDKASGYKVVIYRGNSQVASKTVDTNKFTDVYEYLYLDEGRVSAKIYAVSTKKSSYLLDSEAGIIEDLTALSEAAGSGGLIWEGNKLYYYNETGDRATGWQQIDGSWYHFKSSGAADGPGWFQDKDGCWYWFDSQCRMCVGTVNDGNADYFMNDGSIPDLPYGAWK